MGFDISDLRFLLSAKCLGLAGNSCCTLGRLNLFISQSALDATLREYGEDKIKLPNRAVHFADDILRHLGFSNLDTMDASDYEGASVVHDLNHRIPENIFNKYDMVIDGGTLEHIFNFPVALENLMRMSKVGGHVMIRTPANNQCGHGFYQFSPELFFRVFTPANGFELIRVYLVTKGRHFHIVDPAKVHGRVELLSSDPAMLMVHAKKIAAVPDVLHTPQQSDYLEIWTQTKTEDSKLKAILRNTLAPPTITRISKTLNDLRQRRAVWRWRSRSKLSNQRFYIPVREWTTPSQDAFN
jgi:hypothetical protein